MCESSVWARYADGSTEKVADDVLLIAQEGEDVVLRWFLAEPRRVRGRIIAVDAVKHTVTLEASESPSSERKAYAFEGEIETSHEHPHPHPH